VRPGTTTLEVGLARARRGRARHLLSDVPRWRDATVVVEPLVQVAVSPDAKQIVISHDPITKAPVYLNEDSVSFEFDETNLFRADKFPGYDLYEDGARINVAGRASILWDDGRRGSLLVGRSFRDQANDVFAIRSGLRTKSSDWIVAADAQPITGVSLFTRARLDSNDLSIHRLEAGVNVSNKWGSGYVRYLTDDFNVNLTNPLAPASAKTENLDLGGEIYFGKNWGSAPTATATSPRTPGSSATSASSTATIARGWMSFTARKTPLLDASDQPLRSVCA
jgi:LPS-assembly protein